MRIKHPSGIPQMSNGSTGQAIEEPSVTGKYPMVMAKGNHR
jgi:hypothetical protein